MASHAKAPNARSHARQPSLEAQINSVIMNLGDESDSPWSDQRSHSPQQGSNGTKSEAQPSAPSSASQSVPSLRASVKSPSGRSSRTPRKTLAQSTHLEAVDTDDDPLGPLGASTAAPIEEEPQPPELPQKEPPARRSPRPSTATSQSSKVGARAGPSNSEDDERPVSRSRTGAPGGTNLQDGAPRHPPASVNVERPSFYISVGDPHKVGDLTGSHTAYQVRTKTNSKAFRQPEFEVSRRYKDFVWLYDQLHRNNPGTVVPPPPEKQAVGRFESDFIETRRAALERMLNKTASHIVLQHDGDFKLFLESESFNIDVKQRERKDPDMPSESKGGMFSSLNIGVGSGAKYIEHDDWFLDRRIYLDTLESQLRTLLKSIDTAITQRKHLSDAASDFSKALDSLSQVELSPMLTGPLASLADVHQRIRDLYARQAQQDALTLSNTIDEYIRLIGSIKKAFHQREKSWQHWHTAESDLQKRRAQLDKLHRQGRSQQDRITTIQADVADAERRAHQARLTFEDLGRGMRAELERFEREKVEDFRMGVETWLEGGVEAQKELIELWETYLMHLDADEEEQRTLAEGVRSGDPSAVETWSRTTTTGPGASAGTVATTNNTSGDSTTTGGASTASTIADNDSAGKGHDADTAAAESHTQHDSAALSETTGKPGTDAARAAAEAAEDERDV